MTDTGDIEAICGGPIVNGRLFDGAPPGPFCTVTTKVPPLSIAEPLNSVELMADRAPLGILQSFAAELHPGPSKITVAEVRSKLSPVMRKLNTWPGTGGLGDVSMPLIRAPDTVNGTGLDGAPSDPFCTVTLKQPSLSVSLPFN